MSTYIAKDIKTGIVLRHATKDEVAAYQSQNRITAFFKPLKMNAVLIDECSGYGQCHIPGRFIR